MLLCVIQGTIQVDVAANVQEGEASYYADSLNGNTTASGEPYDKNALSAAHRTLPFGTKVRVTYLKTGQSVEVVINDRGPHAKNRIIDLSSAAAKQIGLIDAGHGKVRLEIIEP
jgi:rare lipoprotein A